jgi:hypothetical protein
MSKPGDEIGRGRSHQHLVRPSGQFNVTHARLGCFIEQMCVDRIAGNSLESQGCYECLRTVAHDDANLGAGFPQAPDQVGGLVSGNSPGHTEKDTPV